MDLAHSLDADDSDSAPLQVAILSFLNALINYKAGEVSIPYNILLVYHYFLSLSLFLSFRRVLSFVFIYVMSS